MNMVKNAALILIAAATLYGGLTNPPAPLEEADYAPIEQVSRQTGGELTYDDVNGTIDIAAKGVTYSLLLSEGRIRINGASCPGDFYTKDGITYMSKGQAFELLDSPHPC
ncbi:hypothetical protein [Paenibacillus soyae]|uniref:Uncharacterized protein n=1 Tax=Paenibacillus soyae TaxID=2969249 RepID=A0A9X2SA92_9BACL|nr:hypothetical protein [Paenibacillus soyae]MCR2803587.1 hypothetical protein [Paenibacillus soyae]